jgi:DNA polymerase/3'-5' exonuclease PolX
MDFFKAEKLANRIVDIFTPNVDLIHIAGSVRRRKPDVKDIEITCIPKKHPTDLFNTGDLVIDPGFKVGIDTIAQKIIKGKPDGRYMQIKLKGNDDINLDLFMPEPDDYYRQYAIRTGSADYSAKIIAAGWVAKGWRGTDQGLRLERDCHAITNTEGKITGWRCVSVYAERPPVWTNEEQFFEWLGVEWKQPWYRNMDS